MTTADAKGMGMGMSVAEAAHQAGVSEATLYSLANRGHLPGARRVGKRIIIHRGVFEDWLRSGHGDPRPQRSEEEEKAG